jgi:predicted alpha/beta-fold hydrolase
MRWLKQALFFVAHVVVHSLFYIAPHFAWKLLVELPLTAVETMIGDQRTFTADRSAAIIVTHWRDKTVTSLFGLGGDSSTVPYTSPLYNGHIGTLIGSVRTDVPVEYERKNAVGADGCELRIDWCKSNTHSVRGVLLLLPGLSSCSATSYIRRYVFAATNCGFHCAVLNTRGMGTAPLTVPHLMSGAFTGDIRHVLQKSMSREQLKNEFGRSLPLIAVGFSLGGNVLCKYVGEQGLRNEDPRLDAAIAINAPWDFHESATHMSRLTQLVVYQPHLLVGLKKYIARHRDMLLRDSNLRNTIESGVVEKLRTVQDFDEHIIVPHFGYESVQDYYSKAMSLPFLEYTKIPTFCLGSADDTVTGPPPTLRRWELLCQRNRNVMYVEAPAGGHLGFLSEPFSELRNAPNFGEQLTLNVASSVCMSLT